MIRKTKEKLEILYGLIIGVLLLLSTNEIINFNLVWKLVIPIIFVSIGLSIIFNGTIKSKISEKVREGRTNGLEDITATFAGQKVHKSGEDFKGANLDAVFGGIVLDLRGANIDKEAVIKASSIFGGIDIFVPTDVCVKVKSTPIFGGVSDKSIANKESEKTIYIEAFCMFGGIDIK